MKILYLSPHVPNPTKIRSHFHVRGLTDAGHQVTVATLERSAQDSHFVSRLRESGVNVISVRLSKLRSAWNALLTAPTALPLQANFMWSDQLMKHLEAHVTSDPPDIIHVEHLRMARYGLRLMRLRPTIFDAVDYLSHLYQSAATVSTSLPLRMIARLEAPRLRHYERQLTGEFPLTIVISNNDLALFQADNSYASRVQLALTGVPITPLPDAQSRRDDILIMTGTLNYHPNVASALYFARSILPLIQQKQPNIRLQLVGANPVPAVQALHNSQIEVTGFVPSINDYLSRAAVALAPVVYGSGMQIKVLEAFQTATPLVATSVALRGLDVRHEEHVLIADTPAEFAAAVLRLLSDSDLRLRIGRAGRQYVEQFHDIRTTTTHLVSLYEQVRRAY